MSLKFSADVTVAKAEMEGETKKIVQFKSKVLQKLTHNIMDEEGSEEGFKGGENEIKALAASSETSSQIPDAYR